MNPDDKKKAREERKALKKQRKEEAVAKKGVFSGFGSAPSSSSSSASSSSSGTSSWGGTGVANWWVKDYGKKKTGESVSSYWTSRVDDSWYGNWSSSYTTKRDETDFDAIISSIRRSANIVTNAASTENSEERELHVKWATSDEHRNTAKGNDVYLSPTVVDKYYTKKKTWTDDERCDVLIGEALVQSTMKHTVDVKTEENMVAGSKTKKGRLESEVWTISEHLFAEKEVLENYPGFKGYFAANRAYYTGKDARKKFEENIQKAKAENKLSPEQATAGLLWDLLHPGDTLKDTPAEMQTFMEWCKERLASETTSEGRSNAAKEIVAQAYKMFQIGDDDGSQGIPTGQSVVKSEIPELGISETGRDEELEIQTTDPVERDPKEASKENPAEVPDTLDKVEWHAGTIEYKVPGDRPAYENHVKRLGNIIRDVRNRLKIRSEEQRMVEHALKKGRLDEGSLYKLAFSRMDYRDEKIFEQEEIISMPQVAFGLLIDESGSMGGAGGAGTYKYEAARDVAIILAEALKGLEGVNLAVWGHTGEGFYQKRGENAYNEMVIHEYYTPKHPEIASLARVKAFSQNLDGYAISHAAKRMNEFFPSASKRVLIHVSDGQPAGNYYGGISALKHVGGICKLARSKGVDVIGIGVCNAFDSTAGNTMYGGGKFVILNGMTGFQNIVTNLVSRVVNSRI